MSDIVVTMTSWKKRIDYVSISILSLLKQTVKPRSIELNLSEEEFLNKENDLPQDLIELTKIYPININWVGANVKSFKKLIPTLKKYWDEKDLYVFTADDDVVYEYNMLEKFLAISEKLPEACICFGKFSGALCDQPVVKGGATLYKVRFFTENVWTQLNETIINTNEDDCSNEIIVKIYAKWEENIENPKTGIKTSLILDGGIILISAIAYIIITKKNKYNKI